VKALTIKQPWADAIVHGSKRVENRTWMTAYRGALALHAGKAADSDGDLVVRAFEPQAAASFPDERGAIIGLATLVDVHPFADVGPGRPHCCTDLYAVREPGTFHWVVRNPIALPEPIVHKGQLGLWQVRDQVAEEIATAARGRRDVRQFL
jgi:hypothetical protein